MNLLPYDTNPFSVEVITIPKTMTVPVASDGAHVIFKYYDSKIHEILVVHWK